MKQKRKKINIGNIYWLILAVLTMINNLVTNVKYLRVRIKKHVRVGFGFLLDLHASKPLHFQNITAPTRINLLHAK